MGWSDQRFGFEGGCLIGKYSEQKEWMERKMTK